MADLTSLQQQKQMLEQAQTSYDNLLKSQCDQIKTLFKALIKEEYRNSLYIHDVHIMLDKNEIAVYVIIPNPVPTEQDDGLEYKFSIKDISAITNSSELYYQHISGDINYLSL